MQKDVVQISRNVTYQYYLFYIFIVRHSSLKILALENVSVVEIQANSSRHFCSTAHSIQARPDQLAKFGVPLWLQDWKQTPDKSFEGNQQLRVSMLPSSQLLHHPKRS